MVKLRDRQLAHWKPQPFFILSDAGNGYWDSIARSPHPIDSDALTEG